MKILILLITVFLSETLIGQSDSINFIDSNQMRQGHWIIYYKQTDKVLQEGSYKDNQRQGIWKQYLDDGTISSEITFVDDEPNGYAKNYFPNGQVSEEGIWKNDLWIGEYKAYYENGKLIYNWNFNENGQRTGTQKYYHENGKLMIEGNWNQGKEMGIIKHFNEKGELEMEQTFDDGKMNPELTIIHKIKKPEEKDDKIKDNPEIDRDTVELQKLEMFETTGDRRTYDSNRRLSQEGYFENGKLIKGKKYFYNSNNEIIRIEIYNKGKLFKTEDIEVKE